MLRKLKRIVVVSVIAGGIVSSVIYGREAAETNDHNEKIRDLLDFGEKYSGAIGYESAIALFETVLKIDSYDAEEYLDKLEEYLPRKVIEEVLFNMSEGQPLEGENEQYKELKRLLSEIMALLPEEFRNELKKQLEKLEDYVQ